VYGEWEGTEEEGTAGEVKGRSLGGSCRKTEGKVGSREERDGKARRGDKGGDRKGRRKDWNRSKGEGRDGKEVQARE